MNRLKLHIKEQHEEKTLLCDKCDWSTNDNFKLKQHIDAVHYKKFTCAECDMVLGRAATLRLHIEAKHPDGTQIKSLPKKTFKSYMCDKCPFKTPWKKYLDDHMDNLHGTKLFSCDQCEYTTRIPKEFKKHWKFRHDPTSSRIPCDQCHFTATRADTLKKHVQVVHENIRQSSLYNIKHLEEA